MIIIIIVITLLVDLLHYRSIITLPVELVHYRSIITLPVDYYITGCNKRSLYAWNVSGSIRGMSDFLNVLIFFFYQLYV